MCRVRSILVVALLACPAVAVANDRVAADFADAMSSETNDTVFRKVVEFAPASTKVSTTDRARIQRLAKTWALGSQQTVIEIHGYSDSLDLGIAERRAGLIRGYLLGAGIAPARIVVVGHTLAPEGRRIDISLKECTGQKCVAQVVSAQPVVIAELDHSRAVSEPQLGTLQRTLIAAPISATASTKADDVIKADRISISPLTQAGPGTTLTVETVLDRIGTLYMPNLQRCYALGLRTGARPGGKIMLAFTVTARGTLDNIKARGVSADVDRCVSNAMTAWKFAVPRTRDGAPTNQDLRIVLAAT